MEGARYRTGTGEEIVDAMMVVVDDANVVVPEVNSDGLVVTAQYNGLVGVGVIPESHTRWVAEEVGDGLAPHLVKELMADHVRVVAVVELLLNNAHV